ncbi:MAG: hypothetical protein ACLUUO_14000 [Sellimonas intestinalis]
MKMNSVTDVDFIETDFRGQSRAGVEVDLLVRGICCIPSCVWTGIYGSIVRVTSIVGRFLEHPRIFSFGRGSAQKLYIGSADMMTKIQKSVWRWHARFDDKDATGTD